uniref:Uncharacterized protein n=1 Tax=Arundo donax TaxID=35708 RepID=A0A0A8XSL4_ARUDO
MWWGGVNLNITFTFVLHQENLGAPIFQATENQTVFNRRFSSVG